MPWAHSDRFRSANDQMLLTCKRNYMSTLIAVGYDDPFKAEEVRMKLQKMQQSDLIDLEDAVVAVKNPKGKVKLDQPVRLTALGPLGGGFLGAIIGTLFMAPLVGLVMGAAVGAAAS